MSGISSKALLFARPENKFRFQNQEFASEEFSDFSGLDIYEFKWRMHDPQMGRFWQIDPLASDYVYNSTYAFSENKVTAHVELEGLEAQLAIAGRGLDLVNYTQKGNDVFKQRADRLNKDAGFTPSQVNNGKQVLDVLKDATSSEGSIQGVVFFSHATGSGLMMDHNEGFYTEGQSYGGDNSANVRNLKYLVENGDIKFEDNAFIVLGGCNCANPGDLSSISFGESLTKNIGITTYAATGFVNDEVVNGKATGRIKTDGTFVKFEKIVTMTPIEPNKKIQIYPPIITTEIRRTEIGSVIDPQKL